MKIALRNRRGGWGLELTDYAAVAANPSYVYSLRRCANRAKTHSAKMTDMLRVALKRVVKTLLVMSGLLATQALKAEDQPLPRWYVGVGIGVAPYADALYEIDSQSYAGYPANYRSTKFTDAANTSVFRAKAGAVFGRQRKHRVGADIGVVAADESNATGDYSLTMKHAIATYTQFPRYSRFVYRAGLGVAELDTTKRTGTETVNDSRDGLAGLLGIGYSFWIGQSSRVVLNLDHEFMVELTVGVPAQATLLYVSYDWY